MRGRKPVVALAIVAAGFAGAGCLGDESGSDPNDGGDQTADTGPTTPQQTALDTGTPEAPTGDETDFQRSASTGGAATAQPGVSDADSGEAESETGVAP